MRSTLFPQGPQNDPENRRPTDTAAFPHPEPRRPKNRIWPVFLPFSGCPQRCVYCSQTAVTATAAISPQKALDRLEHDLNQALERHTRPLELGFFGGTFTALPSPWPQRFLTLASRFRDQGLITKIRCSTRPDAVAPDSLRRLADLGLDMVELGVQTFHEPTLKAARRGYDAHTALAACHAVQDATLELGIQLLPGLPEHTPEHLATDAQTTATLNPKTVRLYPCVVLKNTPLATSYTEGRYSPWTLDQTTTALADTLLFLWKHHIPVIRIGLAPEQDLAHHILAGPWHPALGQLARSLALLNYVASATQPQHTTLNAPKRYQSDTLGHKGSMRQHYQSLGLVNLHFDDEETFRLE